MHPTFYNVADYKFLSRFIENVDVIYSELKRAIEINDIIRTMLAHNSADTDHYSFYWAKENGFLDNITTEGGTFNAFAIYKKDFPIKTCNIDELFPFITQLLNNVPNLHYSAFVRADPSSSLGQHLHNRRHLIFHLLLNDLENGSCVMTCGEEERSLQKKGDSVLFDYSISHGTANYSSSERFNLVVDFNPFIV